MDLLANNGKFSCLIKERKLKSDFEDKTQQTEKNFITARNRLITEEDSNDDGEDSNDYKGTF